MKALFITILVALLIFLLVKTKGDKKTIEKGKDIVNKTKIISNDISLNNLINALDQYYNDNEEYPDNLEKLLPYYLKTKNDLIDSWGNKYKLVNIDEEWFIVSAGKDKKFDTNDDIKRRL